ncbi:hypothetical protein [Winogradskyella psychrotolerans]|nr:hypothetical protein [Winogradskyella psychrotolerans]
MTFSRTLEQEIEFFQAANFNVNLDKGYMKFEWLNFKKNTATFV